MDENSPVFVLTQTHYRILTVLECVYQAAWFRGRPDYPNNDGIDPDDELSEAAKYLNAMSDIAIDEDLWPFAAARALVKSENEASVFSGALMEPQPFSSYHEAALELAREGHYWLTDDHDHCTEEERTGFALSVSNVLDTEVMRLYRAQMQAEYAVVRSGKVGDLSDWNILQSIQGKVPSNVGKKRTYRKFSYPCPKCSAGKMVVRNTDKDTGKRHLYCNNKACGHTECRTNSSAK